MKERIRLIMEAHHMTQQTFANFVGINAGSLSGIFNNRTKPTLNTVEALKNKIPNLNVEWLMFGRGSMFETDDKNIDQSPTPENNAGVESSIDFGGMPGDLFGSNPDAGAQHPHRQTQISAVKPEIKYVERPQRQITEIRVYFDDLTYETFVPKK